MSTGREVALFAFAAIGCSVTVGTVLWRAITLKLKGEVLLLRHDLEKKDLQIDNLQNVQTLMQKGLEEKFGHFSQRTRGEVAALDQRTRQIENFLSKTTDFEPRN